MSDDESDLEYEEQTVTVGSEASGRQMTLKVTSLANEALPLEMLLALEARKHEISGQRLWEGSLLLCNHVIAHFAHAIVGKRVLELGAGCGIVGLTCAKLGAAEVYITDGDAKCLPLIGQNITANNLSAVAKAAVLKWGNAAALAALSPLPFDFVVAGDVLYKKELVAPLLSTVRAALRWPPCSQLGLGLAAAGAPGGRQVPSASDSRVASSESGVSTSGEGEGASADAAAVATGVAGADVATLRAADKQDSLEAAGASAAATASLADSAATADPAAGATRQRHGSSDRGLLLCHIPRAGVEHCQVAAALRELRAPPGGGARSLAVSAGDGGGVAGTAVCDDDVARAQVYALLLRQ
ncbi:putative methyltransferase-domain-containing protein [Tribonema minus]|uniref:Putative methyltransferase-domain-containing protein n=1 Tax=Tribonema minus TaxID=303371 RepID=A0A835YP02_9STRA|nr:putative methyltransferase-domain-containing protein [Tribonema minus]